MSRIERQLLYLSGTALLVSGAAWLAVRYLPGLPMSEALAPLAMKIHGAAAMAILVVIGMLIPAHVVQRWPAAENLSSGIALLAGAAALTATGWGLYYAGDEALRRGLSGAHWAAGVASVPLLLMHRGHRQR